jgi:glycosyltransferase involved in cell wall biosynthesis
MNAPPKMTAATPPLDVYGWLADRTGCGHIRIMTPLTQLREHGLRTGWSERLETSQLPRTLIGQRICNPGKNGQPGPSDLWQDLARRKHRPKLVFELDDNLWDVDYRSASAHEFFNGDSVVTNLNTNIQCADAVTVTTEPLADLVRHLNPNVHVIPNYLPAWLLDHERPRRDGQVVIGWGGSGTHEMDLAEVAPSLRRYLERAPARVELHLMGQKKPPQRYRHTARETLSWPERYRLPLDRIRWSPWTNSVPDYWRAIDYSIMLAPLRAHNFNRGKSPLRVLEAAILGIPVVASDYGPYADFVQHGVTGFLVKSDHEWGKHLRALVEDEAMRTEMGVAARRQAADWTIEQHADDWQKVLAP